MRERERENERAIQVLGKFEAQKKRKGEIGALLPLAPRILILIPN